MKYTKTSSLILILILLFIAVDLAGYRLLHNNIKMQYDKDMKILFYQIKDIADELTNQLLTDYIIHKKLTLKKHHIVQTYLQKHDLNVSLDEIHTLINADDPRKPYHIYITDKNLTIRNTTYKPDLGFDLSFAKTFFDTHFQHNEIGYSPPIQNKPSNRFVSFTDSYITKKGDSKAAILQIGYVYPDTSDIFKELETFINVHPIIKGIKAYGYDKNDFAYKIVFKNTGISSKPTIDILKNAKKEAKKALNKLGHNTLYEERYEVDGKPYRLLSITNRSRINKDMSILYTLWIDESDLHFSLLKLNIIMLIIALLGILAIVIIVKIQDKERKLNEQENFIQSAMHEIKTPLSIITLNNELRAMEFGNDSYTQEIDSAIKTLRNSYETMGFVLTKKSIEYPIDDLDLAHIVQERVNFFQSIARSNHKSIVTDIKGTCIVHISYIELVRFIDNNLSNALKYSDTDSSIIVTIREHILSFHNNGEPILDTKKVFERYVRENRTVGGYGLGLNIIQEIAQKYDIQINVHSTLKNGTTFRYTFSTRGCSQISSIKTR